MKKLLLILLCLPMIGFGQNINIPDANFKAYLVGNSSINTNGDTEIQVSEAVNYNGSIDCDYLGIFDLTGIEFFNNITSLNCSWNQLTNINLSNNTSLVILKCQQNQLTSLDVSNNNVLVQLWCSNNQLTSLDVSNNIGLAYLSCGFNYLTSINVNNLNSLGSFYIEFNQISSIDLSNNTNLTYFFIHKNQLTSLDLSQNTSLISLDCSMNQINSLDLSNHTALMYLSCYNNHLTSLDLRNGNNIAFSSGIMQATNNYDLYCIDVDDPIWSSTNLTNIDSWATFSSNCQNELYGCTDPNIINYNPLATVDNWTCDYGMTYIPDDNFEQALINSGIDSDSILNDSILTNQVIFVESINLVYHWNYNYNDTSWQLGQNIDDLTGIEDFISLTYLNFAFNNISTVDLSQNINLKTLYTSNNNLSGIDISSLTQLERFTCRNNQIDSLNLSNNSLLIKLQCENNQLTSLDLRNGNNLNIITSGGEKLNLTNNPNLYCVDVDDVGFSITNWTVANGNIDSTVSFSANCAIVFGCLDSLACNYNPLVTIDDGSCGYNTASYDTLIVSSNIIWNGIPLNVSGDYSVTLINSVGCDSIVNLNLTVTTIGISNIANNKRNIVKITDMLGQETPYRRNTPLFYIYDDGTVEKRIVIN